MLKSYHTIMMKVSNFEGRGLEQKEALRFQVWIIDDSESWVGAMKRSVGRSLEQKAGEVEIRHFSDGESALEETQKGMPDVITVDGDLGEGKMRGVDIVRELAKRNVSSGIVAMSSIDDYNREMQVAGEDFGIKIFAARKSSDVGLIIRTILEAGGRGGGD